MNKILRCISFLWLILVFVFSSCQVSSEDSYNGQDKNNKHAETWTFLVYMAADNDLESAAISDLNEMESSLSFLSKKSNILVLFDRAEGYDATNGDWKDTRLYRVKKDESSAKSQIVSERLDLPSLGIYKDSTMELDMANPETLAEALDFVKNKYSSEHYGLIIWGHGNGWRSETQSLPETNIFKAVAADSYSDSCMSIGDLRRGIEKGMGETPLDFIGFDTCFGSCMELCYELRSVAKILAGTPALVPSGGWNYTELFESFAATDMTCDDLCVSLMNQFKDSYSSYSYGAFSVIDLSLMENVAKSFDDFMRVTAEKITDSEKSSDYRNLCEESVRSYCGTAFPCDYFLDIKDFAEKLIQNDSSLAKKGEQFLSDLDRALLYTWSPNEDDVSFGLYYSDFAASGCPVFGHSDSYIHGSRETNVCQFVNDFSSYVPTNGKTGSFLDKVFYKQ